MCSEDFRPPIYMAKPSSWVPGSLTQIAEGQVAIFFETGTDYSPAWSPSCGFLVLAS